MCAASSECVSTICGGNVPTCCAVACPSVCYSCQGGASCVPACNSATGCAPLAASGCPTNIACRDRVAGWSGARCEWYSADSPGKCSNGGGCTTMSQYEYCDGAPRGGATSSVACGSTACRRTSACQRGDAKPAGVADVCFTDSLQHGCAAGQACDAQGTCKKNFGQSCMSGSEW